MEDVAHLGWILDLGHLYEHLLQTGRHRALALDLCGDIDGRVILAYPEA